MANTARDLIKARISNTPGTSGGFTLSTAFTNSLLPVAGDDGLSFKLNITENGVGTELRKDCTYTHSSTSFSRGTMVRSTGVADAALAFTSAAVVSVVPSAEDFPVIVRANVSVNDAGAATANTSALNALAATIAASSARRMRVVFPDGDIYYDGQIVWTAPPSNQTVSSLSTDESHWPSFESDGSTTFISTTSRNGGDWVFQGITGTQSNHLRFVGLRWVGPGVVLRDNVAIAATLSANATSCTVPAGTTVSAGDAICISSDAYASMVSPPPHWATVTNTSGTNPITVTFANQPTLNNFAATSGNIATIFRNQCAVQIGGYDVTRQDVFFNTTFDRCAFIDYFSAIRLNDTTTQTLDRCWWNFCMFGVEYGYNIDGTHMLMPYQMCQVSAQSSTATSGSAVVATATEYLKVGMSLNNATSTLAATFPDHAVIKSIDGANQVTMTHPSTATATRSTVPTMGVFLANGKTVSPWYPLQPAGAGGSGNRTNADLTIIKGLTASHLRAILATDGDVHGGIEFDGVYPESCQRVALIGGQSGPTTSAKIVMRNGKIEGTNVLSGPAIQFGSGNGSGISLLNIQSSPDNRVALIDFRNISGPQIEWDTVAWATQSGVYAITGQYYFNGLSPSGSDRCYFNLTSARDTGYALALGSVSGTKTNELNQVDLLTLTLAGNTTIANAPWAAAATGKRLRIVAQQNGTGGYTLTLGSEFVDFDASALGTSAAGTANQCMVLDFMWRGAKWVLTAGAFSWAAA